MNVKLESDTMKPYFIAVERTGYSVYEHKATETGEKKGTPYDDPVGYYTSLPACVKKIAKCLAHDRMRGKSMAVLEYAKELARIEESVAIDGAIRKATV